MAAQAQNLEDMMMDTALAPTPVTSLEADLVALLGPERVSTDLERRKLFSEDVFEASPHIVSLIAVPHTTQELAEVVAAANRHAVAIAPRGAGMSYTRGYIPATESSLAIDTTAMNRILKIDADNMVVTVQAGVSWAALNAALAEQGLRTPFWGPMSGIYSTIGAGISQLNAMFGAGHYGTSSESVVALTMVLADGSLLKTGARVSDGDSPFYRHFGPDLAGLFCGDCGTLGLKAEVTLRLIRMPAHEDYASFSFPSGAALVAAMAEMARAGIASEICGFDPGLTKVRMRRMSLASDVKTLGAVISREKSVAKGLMAAARVALGGRDFIEPTDYPLHVIAEGRSKEAVAHDIATAREIAKRFGGHEIENSIARIIRAMPFPPPNSMLGPDGESWAPVHVVAPLGTAPAIFDEIQALFAQMAPEFEAHGIHTGYLFSSLATNAAIIEPVFFWPHGYRPVHASMVEPAHLARLPQLPPNPAATEVVTRARNGVAAIGAKHGCGHFQIGRSYPYRQSRDDASKALLDLIKAHVDPNGLFNPGGLGFPE
jgi:FAD/FMN-containing dehydrogenase